MRVPALEPSEPGEGGQTRTKPCYKSNLNNICDAGWEKMLKKLKKSILFSLHVLHSLKSGKNWEGCIKTRKILFGLWNKKRPQFGLVSFPHPCARQSCCLPGPVSASGRRRWASRWGRQGGGRGGSAPGSRPGACRPGMGSELLATFLFPIQ